MASRNMGNVGSSEVLYSIAHVRVWTLPSACQFPRPLLLLPLVYTHPTAR
jgi:hypothetical protein